MRRWPVAIALVTILMVAGAGVYLTNDQAPPTLELQDDFQEVFATTERPATNTCVVNEGDVVIESPIYANGNVVIVSTSGSIIVHADIQTDNAISGDGQAIYTPTGGSWTRYVIANSGFHGGHILLLAPHGTITVDSTLQTGAGGHGADAYQAFLDPESRQESLGQLSDRPVSVYGGYGGFGGSIYLGAQATDITGGAILPGPGGNGGNAELNGATIYDLAKGGHGGMAGQAYLLNQSLAIGLTEFAGGETSFKFPMDTGDSTLCDQPMPFYPDSILPAALLEPTAQSCRGGHGGNAITTGLLDNGPRFGWDGSIAGVASGGNGGWGCPGGNGGHATSYGAPGEAGVAGEDGKCPPSTNGNGRNGLSGRDAGLAGHAVAGDGGAGAPGQNLEGANTPTTAYWFYGWSDSKVIEYDTHPSWPVRWPAHNGGVPDVGNQFPMLGSDIWYIGGDGGIATSIGGDGGDGGTGGQGRSGPITGTGGAGGSPGQAAGPLTSLGGWAGFGSNGVGTPGKAIAEPGLEGEFGARGANGSTSIAC